MNEHMLFNLVDLAGTFAFAISGATAARRCNLDLFGILMVVGDLRTDSQCTPQLVDNRGLVRLYEQ